MSQFPASFPGIGPGSLTLTPRTTFIMATNENDFLPGGKLIDGSQARDPGNTVVTELRPGLILGKISATTSGAITIPIVGNYAAAVIGELQTALVIASSAGTLTAASAIEVTRRLGTSGTLVLTGAPTATGTVASNTVVFTAVNTTTGVITFNASTNTAYTAGTWVGANDGSYVPVTVLSGTVFPLKVTDINGANMQATPLPLISITNKPYDTAQILNYPAAANTTLISNLKTKLRVSVPGAAFSDDF